MRLFLLVVVFAKAQAFTNNAPRILALASRRQAAGTSTERFMAASFRDLPNTLESTTDVMADILLEDEHFVETLFEHQKDMWKSNLSAGLIAIATLAGLAKMALLGGATSHGLFLDTQYHLAHGAACIQGMATNVWTSYEHVLAESPVRTKAVTSATVYTIGDIIAQKTEGAEQVDKARVVRSLFAGLIGHGPMSHFYYNLNEGLFNDVLHWTEWWVVFPKIVVDQSMFAPIWNNSYILLLGLMKMESPENIVKDMKETTIPLIVEGLKMWPLVHCITYGVIPVENRLLWVDLVEIVWVTILATKAAEQSKSTSALVATEVRAL